MKKHILVAVMTIFSFAAFSQATPEEIIKKFFTEYSTDPGLAIDNLYATNPWTTKIKAKIEDLKNEVATYTIDYMGKYYGYELITKKQLTESFVLYSYLVKYDRQPLRFIFKIYKPENKWGIYSFKVDFEVDDELEDAAKIDNLNLDKVK